MFSDPGFEGMVGVLEKGAYPVPEAWGFPSPFVGSLRPLKMVSMCVYPLMHITVQSLLVASLVNVFFIAMS